MADINLTGSIGLKPGINKPLILDDDIGFNHPRNTYGIWTPPTIASTGAGSEGSIVPAGGWADAEEAIENMWEPLREQYPELITRELLGKDTSGIHNIWCYIITPEKAYEKTNIVTSCLHGNEYIGYYGSWAFVKCMLEKYKLYPHLEYLRNNVRLVLVPIVNPWGFTNGFRQNVNGVDLNRNFGHGTSWERFKSNNLDSGFVSSATTLTLVDTNKDWSTDNLTRTKVVITEGKGAGSSGYILSHTSNELTLFPTTPFAETPDNTSKYIILSKYYKGTERLSENESQIMAALLDEYKDATVHLDLHSIVTTDAHNIMYYGRYMNNPMAKIERIIKKEFKTDERIVWGSSTLPTFTNYAHYTYGMMGGNPEIKNNMYGRNRDSVEMTRVVYWFGNIILAYATQTDKGNNQDIGEPFVKHLSYDGLGTEQYSLYQIPHPTNLFKKYNPEIRGMRLCNSGTTFLAVDNANKAVFQFELKDKNNLNSMVFTGNVLELATELEGELYFQDINISPDGTKMYIVGSTGKKIYQFTLSNAFDITTAAKDELDLDISAVGTMLIPTSISFSYDGLKAYISGADNTNVTGSKIYQFTLSAAWDVTEATYDDDYLDVNSDDTTVRCIEVREDITKRYIFALGVQNNTVIKYSFLLDNDVSSADKTDDSLDVSGVLTSDEISRCITLSECGRNLYFLSTNRNIIWKWEMETSCNLKTAERKENEMEWLSKRVGDNDDMNITGMTIVDTNRLFAIDKTYRNIIKYNLKNNYIMDKQTYVTHLNLDSLAEDEFYGLAFSSTGDKFYVLGRNTKSLYQFDLTSNYTLTGATVAYRLDLSSLSNPQNFCLNPDGSTLYVLAESAGTQAVHQYTLSTEWGLSTATIDVYSKTIAESVGTVTAMECVESVSLSSKYLFVVTEEAIIRRYTWGISDNISTATLNNMLFDASYTLDVESIPQSITVSSGGSHLHLGIYKPHFDAEKCRFYRYKFGAVRDLLTLKQITTGKIIYNTEMKTCWTSYFPFPVGNTYIIKAQGAVSVKSDRDCTILVKPMIYQPYSPDYKYSYTLRTFAKMFQKRVPLKANEETIVPVNYIMQSQPTNIGMGWGSPTFKNGDVPINKVLLDGYVAMNGDTLPDANSSSSTDLVVLVGSDEGNDEDTVTIPLTFANVTTLTNVTLLLLYDHNSFDFLEGSFGGIVNNSSKGSISKRYGGLVYINLSDSSTPITTDGLFAELQFKINSTRKAVKTFKIADYGATKRTQEVTFRVNFQSEFASSRIWLKALDVSLTAIQSDLGTSVELYLTDGERKAYTDIQRDGVRHTIVHPHPSKWNVDNYGDGDGGEIVNSDENDDEGEGTVQG